MTVMAVEDWMTPVINVPASTPLIGVPAALARNARISVDRKRLDAVRHEFEAEHEDAQPADDRHENVLEDIYVHLTRPQKAPSAARFSISPMVWRCGRRAALRRGSSVP